MTCEIDASSLESIRRARDMARRGLHEMIRQAAPELDDAQIERLSLFARAVADGAFLAHHIDPKGTDVRALLGLLRTTIEAEVLRTRSA